MTNPPSERISRYHPLLLPPAPHNIHPSLSQSICPAPGGWKPKAGAVFQSQVVSAKPVTECDCHQTCAPPTESDLDGVRSYRQWLTAAFGLKHILPCVCVCVCVSMCVMQSDILGVFDLDIRPLVGASNSKTVIFLSAEECRQRPLLFWVNKRHSHQKCRVAKLSWSHFLSAPKKKRKEPWQPLIWCQTAQSEEDLMTASL